MGLGKGPNTDKMVSLMKNNICGVVSDETCVYYSTCNTQVAKRF